MNKKCIGNPEEMNRKWIGNPDPQFYLQYYPLCYSLFLGDLLGTTFPN